MKKTLIALALVALPVASMADVILYGQIKAGVEVSKIKGIDGTDTAIVDYGSRIGFKGHEHLDGNLQAIWQLEQKVNVGGGATGFGTRNSFIGLKGDFGTVKAGYQNSALGDVHDKLDQWEYSNGSAGLGIFARDTLATRRLTAISYETPNFAGFSAKASVAPSQNVKNNVEIVDDKDRAVYGLSASYENNGIFADVAGAYAHANRGEKDGFQAIAQAGYESDKWMAGVAYKYTKRMETAENFIDGAGLMDSLSEEEATNAKKLGIKESHEVAVSGAYNVTDALRLKASAAVGTGIKDESGEKLLNGKYYQGIVGADYALSKRTIANAQVGYTQFGKKDDNIRGGAVSIGMVHKF